MRTIGELLGNFFTHKDFLPPADQISGTLFTPLHLIFSLLCIGAVVFGILRASKKEKRPSEPYTAACGQRRWCWR